MKADKLSKKTLFLLIGCWLCMGSLQAQFQKPDMVLPSSNAATLGTFGDHPISPFTGLPQINIPIYQLQEGNIAVPISLSYNASGVKPDEHPGWTGVNWFLQAGGAITRTVKDVEDEFDASGSVVRRQPYFVYSALGIDAPVSKRYSGTQQGYYFQRNRVKNLNWLNPSNDIKNMARAAWDIADTESDEYNFQFLNYSGKFFLKEDGSWAVQSDQIIRVELLQDPFMDVPANLQVSEQKHYLAYKLRGRNSKTFRGFTLTTEDGTRYTFGGTTEAVEYGIPFFEQMVSHWAATSWYLTSIESAEGHKVQFSYQPDGLNSNMYVSMLFNLVEFYNKNNDPACVSYGNTENFGNGQVAYDFVTPRYASYAGSLIRPVYLKEVKTSLQKVVFIRTTSVELAYPTVAYEANKQIPQRLIGANFEDQPARAVNDAMANTNPAKDKSYWPFLYDIALTDHTPTMLQSLLWKKLDQIQVSSLSAASAELVYDFTYGNTANERLQLASISKKSNTEPLQPYTHRFTYYDDPTITLPGYFEEAIDYWGYYNANTEKLLTVPRKVNTAYDPTKYTNTVRKPTSRLAIAQEGVLKTIVYPVQGKTEFIYEINEYGKRLADTHTSLIASPGTEKAGGLRIRKTITDPLHANGQLQTREYFYGYGYQPGLTPENLVSSGVLTMIPVYSFSGEFAIDHKEVKKSIRICISSQNVSAVSANTTGYHIGYDEVVEKREDGSYTIYKYTNYDNEGGKHFDDPIRPGSYTDNILNTPYGSRALERGRLYSLEHYHSSGKLLSHQNTTYARHSESFVKALYLNASTYTCFSGDLFDHYWGIPYVYHTYKYLPVSQKTQHYDQLTNQYVEQTTRYVYNSFGQVSLVGTSLEPNEEQITKYQYVSDCNFSWEAFCQEQKRQCDEAKNKCLIDCVNQHWDCDNCEQIYGDCNEGYTSCVANNTLSPESIIFREMNRRHILSPIVTQTSYISKEGTGKIVGGVLNLYKEYHPGVFQLSKVYQLELPQPLDAYSVYLPYTYGDFYLDEHYSHQLVDCQQYTPKGNLAEYRQEDNIPHVMLWNIQGAYPVAKIDNAHYEEVAYTNFEPLDGHPGWDLEQGSSSFENMENDAFNGNYVFEFDNGTTWLGKRGLQADKTYILSFWCRGTPRVAIDFQYISPVRMRSMTDWTYYEYEVSETQSVFVSGQRYTKIDDLRFYPKGALMITYTHDPLTGVTSATDTNGKTTYYEYDGLQRLKTIRDPKREPVEQLQFQYKQ